MNTNFNAVSKLLIASGLMATVACQKVFEKNELALAASANDIAASAFMLKNYSVTPPLIKKLAGFESVEAFSLIGSDDTLQYSPNFVFGGSADGAGLLRLPDGGLDGIAEAKYAYVVNHEDNFAVSRILLDKRFRPLKGEYILNSNGGTWRLCSATMATQQEHGFGPTFLTCGESGEESRTHAINPLESPYSAAISKEVPAFGRWSAENALPLPLKVYNKTVIMLTDDDSGNEGGQVNLYMSDVVGDLNNGALYTLRRKDLTTKERTMTTGNAYDVEFVKIDDASTLTGRQLNVKTTELSAIKFGRVEDIDYRKGAGANSRDLYFTVTGQPYSGTNADSSRTKYGRVYHLTLSKNNPLKGTLEVILDGDVRPGIADQFQDPDNICATENYVYVQEDPNSYGDETHDAYIYQYNILTKELKKVFELDHRRDAPDALKYNPTGSSSKGSWEYGSLVDISDIVGVPDAFMLCIQPHTWRDAKYAGVDGGTIRTTENQASQVLLLKGLPR
ncbi:hypothetical protein BH10BAC2_BH10BAC2_11000 [soil metagenome]